ncbi:MAG TPA: hypothetical protein VGL13_01945 [Polyangiaceae bacterium]
MVHFSVQLDHVHLIVEAHDKRTLSSGVRGLSISIARRVNGLVNRRGRVWADRWHGRALDSPRAVRNALGYVLANFRKHRPASQALFDAYSSAPDFAWFAELEGRTPRELANAMKQAAPESNRTVAFGARASPGSGRMLQSDVKPADIRGASAVVPAQSWLLKRGWRRLGTLSIEASPKPAKR